MKKSAFLLFSKCLSCFSLQGDIFISYIAEIVHKPNTDFGYNPKIPSTQRLLVFSIPIEGVLHEYG